MVGRRSILDQLLRNRQLWVTIDNLYWRGQVYFSIIQRTVLNTENGFVDWLMSNRVCSPSIGAPKRRPLHSNGKFTRDDLTLLLKRLSEKDDYLLAA
jgi:hypothetical protein